MPVSNFSHGNISPLSSVTVKVTEGSEPDLGIAVDLNGNPAINARGVVFNSRKGYITVALLGQIPVKVANGQTITVGSPVAVNSSGLLIAGATGLNILGIALETVTSSSNNFIEVFVNPNPPSGGGSDNTVWGGITGTLSSQTDLQNNLNEKQANLVNQTNLKSINNNTLLGDGDLVIDSTTIPNFNESIDDRVASLLIAGSGVDLTYSGTLNTLTLSSTVTSVDHISLTNTTGLVKTYTAWGNVAETINLGTFNITDGSPPPVVVLTEAAYTALGTYDNNTFYVING